MLLPVKLMPSCVSDNLNRFEGKHALAKRYASICGNFIDLPVSVGDIHQISHAAEMMDISSAVREEVHTAKRRRMMTASSHENFQALSTLAGIEADSILTSTKRATIGGFDYEKGFYVAMPNRVNGLPVFGRILDVLAFQEEVIVVIEDQSTVLYDETFGAFLVERACNSITRAVYVSSLPSVRPMNQWRRYDCNDLTYLSPRSCFFYFKND